MHIYVYKVGKITAKKNQIMDCGFIPRISSAIHSAPKSAFRQVGHVTAASVAAAGGAVSCMHAASGCLST